MKVGDRITVLDLAAAIVHPVTVTGVWGPNDFAVRAAAGWTALRFPGGYGIYAVEGIGWCHGWEGEAVDALLATHALS